MSVLDLSRRSHRLALVALIFIGSACLWQLLAYVPRFPAEYRPFFYNSTDSLPRGLYVRVPMRELRDGDYVIFKPTEAITSVAVPRGWMKEGTMFLKKVGAMPGESYEIDGRTGQFFVRGEYVGQIYEEDREGRSMPKLRGSFVVPEGEFLPIGTNPRSFDGRYTGTVPLDSGHALVKPLLTGSWMP